MKSPNGTDIWGKGKETQNWKKQSQDILEAYQDHGTWKRVGLHIVKKITLETWKSVSL